MPSDLSNVQTLMMWPWTQTKNNGDWLTMMREAQEVVTARMPTLWKAFFFPFEADYTEIGLMWSEKTKAFDQSSSAMESAGRSVEHAAEKQQGVMAKARGGGTVTFGDMLEMYQRNLAAMTALAALPTAVLKPISTKVSANAKRLGQK
ncbi:hypothetical protein [Sphingobium subterraneum]|uniref:Phasin domain-containing protein n=1 Tax=Sphingobium subterraneum TaxID=627688 RepID=A0A841IXI9_9SPHN|nr:hypothetical protein [Sphingobium subterraneum]MBB6123347.1 hypothetical protein [Sphingobium subterraneum]